MSCNLKICCQCKHNIQGVDNTTQYQRCLKKGYKFELCEESKDVIDVLRSKKIEVKK